MSIQVIKPGALSTLQDVGRVGYQRFGVTVGGVMDEWSHRIANLLVGNDENEATLEMTMQGPSLLFKSTQLIAICGADMSPTINKQPVPQRRPVLVKAGSQLDFGLLRQGARGYLAVAGGYRVQPVMHSKATFIRGGFGGFEGRALQKMDELEINPNEGEKRYPSLSKQLEQDNSGLVAPTWSVNTSTGEKTSPLKVRVVAGQQWQAFTEEAQANFAESTFQISTQSDRMGYRIEGTALALRQPLELISEAVGFGTIQVPPDGNPIILMADRQPTGGYPKIAQVASVDLPLLAQMLPKERLQFSMISLDDAQRLYFAREDELALIRQAVEMHK